jgi:predicted ATP-dependent endonuclease of OLD family
MYFSDVQISNYKSYRESSRLDLATGINIIVGKNNAGKTALLEALSLKFNGNPHRTIETVPFPTRGPQQESSVTFTFTLTKHELTDLLIAAQGDGEFYLPLPDLENTLVQQQFKLARNYSIEAAKTFGEWFFSHDSYTSGPARGIWPIPTRELVYRQ